MTQPGLVEHSPADIYTRYDKVPLELGVVTACSTTEMQQSARRVQ
jgi:hypothetical protein